VPLNAQRFGRTAWRWAALAPLLALPLAGWWLVDRARAGNPVWKVAAEQKAEQEARAEEAAFKSDYVPRVEQAAEDLEELLARLRNRKEPAPLVRLEETQARLAELADAVRNAGPYRSAAARRLQEKELGKVEKLQDRAEEAVKKMRAALARKADEAARDKKEEEDFSRRFDQQVNRVGTAALKAFDAAVPLIRQAPAARDADALKRALEALKQQGTAAVNLRDLVATAGPYESALAAEWQTVAISYMNAAGQLLELTRRELAGDPQGDAVLRAAEKKVRENQKAWNAFWEP
jgi:hypothetical protein